MNEQIEIKGKVQWVVFKGENDIWIGNCDSLGIAMEGDTFDDLLLNIHDSIDLLFESLIKHGDTGQFFKERGWDTSELSMLKGNVIPLNISMEDSHDLQAKFNPAIEEARIQA